MPVVSTESTTGGNQGRLFLGQQNVGSCRLKSVIWLTLGKKSKRRYFTVEETLFIKAISMTKPNLARRVAQVIALRSLRGLTVREISIRLGRPDDKSIVSRRLHSGYRELKRSRSLQKIMGYATALERSVSQGIEYRFEGGEQ